MKFGLKVATVLGLLFVGMLVFNQGLRLMSEPSDMAVLGGVAIMIGYIALATYLGRLAFRKIKAKVDSLDLHSGMIIAMLAVAGVSMFASGCNKVIPPGHVGIKVNQSGSDRGVQDFPLQTGRVFYNPITEDVLDYPTYVQRVIWTRSADEGKSLNEEINYNSKDELVFHGDFTCSYELAREKVPHFYVRFRNDDISSFTHGFFRDQVRDALNEVAVNYTADELYGEKKTEFLEKALARLKSRVEPFGVNVMALGYASSPRPPEQVAKAINNKIEAIQRAIQAENEKREATAQASKVIELAKGTAEANQRIAASITANIVEWRRLDVQQQAISRWNGAMPQYSGGGAMPLIQLK